MTLLRRAPREVYRVYREDEFLDGLEGEGLSHSDHEELAGAEQHPAEAAAQAAPSVAERPVPGSGPRPGGAAPAGNRRRRVVAMATLACAICALGVVLAASKHADMQLAPRPAVVGAGPAARTPAGREAGSEGNRAPGRRPTAPDLAVERPSRASRAGRAPASGTPAPRPLASGALMPAGAADGGDGVHGSPQVEFGFER